MTPGNVHDSVAFDEVYDKVTTVFSQVETIVADSAYKTPYICKQVFEDGRVLSTAYKRPQTMKGGHEWWKYGGAVCLQTASPFFFTHSCGNAER